MGKFSYSGYVLSLVTRNLMVVTRRSVDFTYEI